MEQDEFQRLWQTAGQPAGVASPDPQHPLDSAHVKVNSELASLRPKKALALALGIGWVVVVAGILVRVWPGANPFFLASAGLQALLTLSVIVLYVYQLVLLRRVDASATVVATQHRIARLQATTLWSVRISFLQLPCWTTFYLSTRLLAHAPLGWLLVQAAATLLAVFAAAWLCWNIRYENRHKRWFQRFFSGPEWQPLIRSLQFLEQVEDYQAAPEPEVQHHIAKGRGT